MPKRAMFSGRLYTFSGFVLLTVVSIGLAGLLLWQSRIHYWESRFAAHTLDVSRDLHLALYTNEAVLAGFAAFLQAVDQGDEAAAARYAATVLAAYPHIYMLEVARAVPTAEQEAFEQRLRSVWRADFALQDFSELTRQPAHPRAALGQTWPVLFMYPVLPQASAIYGVRLETVGHLSHALAEIQQTTRPVASPLFAMYEGGNAYILMRSVSRDEHAERPAAGPQLFGSAMAALLLITADALSEAAGQAVNDPWLSISATLKTTPASDGPLFSRPAADASDWDRWLLPLLERHLELESESQPIVLTFERQLRVVDVLELQTVAILAALGLALALLPPLTLRHFKAVAVAEYEHERSAYLATHDVLTGLPNRYLLADRFDSALAQQRRTGSPFAVLVIDLDRFKQINDEHGHATGDQVLQAAAARLVAVSRASDTVARYGGDEFIVLLRDVRDQAAAERIAAKIREAVQQPIATQSGEQQIACSIGIALCPSDGEQFDTLLAHADQAMYAAKHAGRRQMA